MLPIMSVFALERLPIRPEECAGTMHLIVEPVSNVDSAVCPLVDTKSSYLVLNELSFVGGTITPLEGTLSMFLTV
jgi:hypothetical protein